MIDIQSPAPESAITSSATAPKILFADDEDDLREVIELLLLDEGYQVMGARDGCEVVTMFGEFQPDLVILDMHMPLMNGSDACAVIRQISNVPIIMFTSADDHVNVRGAINKGTTDFVLKTTGIDQLTERVALHLAKKNLVAQKPVVSTVVQVSGTTPEQFTSTTLIVDPDEQIRSGIKEILTRSSQDFIEVATAAEAVLAVEQHDPDIVITEWSLPDSDAVKLLTDLRRRGGDKKLLDIVMSKRLSPEIQRKLQFANINRLLVKPLDPFKAEVMIGECVSQARKNLKQRASKTA